MNDLTEEDAKRTHPGFSITCDKCKCPVVIFTNTLGFSAESGGWGSCDLICQKCGASTELVSS